MSLKTIQCRLVASEETRCSLWHLMAEKNTPLVNALLKSIAEDSRFEEWCQSGKISLQVVKEHCNSLKEDPKFAGQPGRFYTSAIALVHRIYKSWLALRKRLINQIEGQTRWLTLLQSDEDLIEASGSDLATIKAKARELLSQISSLNSKKSKLRVKASPASEEKSKQEVGQQSAKPGKELFKLYEQVDDTLTRCAIVYLLKNGSKIPDKAEDPKRFAKRYRKTEIRLERLNYSLEHTRLPKGRDLSWEECMMYPENWTED